VKELAEEMRKRKYQRIGFAKQCAATLLDDDMWGGDASSSSFEPSATEPSVDDEPYCDPKYLPQFNQAQEEVGKALFVREKFGDLKQAEQLLRKARDGLPEPSAVDSSSLECACALLLAVTLNLADTLEAQGNIDEAISMLQDTLKTALGPLEDVARSNLSKMTQNCKIQAGTRLFYYLRGAQRLAESESVSRELVSDCRLWYGEEDPITQTEINNLGVTLKEQGKFDEAAALLDEALVWRGSLPQSTPSVLISRLNRATILLEQGEFPRQCAELEAVYRELFYDMKISMSSGVQGAQWETEETVQSSPKDVMDKVADGFGKALLGQGSYMRTLGNFTEAESFFREAVDVFSLSSAGSFSFSGFGTNPNGMQALSILLDTAKDRGATEEEINAMQQEYTDKLISTQFMEGMKAAFGENAAFGAP